MTRRTVGGSAVAAALAIGAAGAPLAASAVELRPHRAVYDLSLVRAEPGASISEANGRLVYDLTGNACEGYTVNLRFVTRVADREGAMQVTDVRSTTTETLQPATFSFNNQTLIDEEAKVHVVGKAEATAKGVVVDLSEPKETTLELPRAIFPTAHTRLILEAAEAGERVQEIMVYDGGDNADALYETTTVIGEARTGRPEALQGERAPLAVIEDIDELRAWRIVLSYFKADGEPGERVPDQELTFSILENGVSYNATFDYGVFAMSGVLNELTLADTPSDCDADAAVGTPPAAEGEGSRL